MFILQLNEVMSKKCLAPDRFSRVVGYYVMCVRSITVNLYCTREGLLGFSEQACTLVELSWFIQGASCSQEDHGSAILTGIGSDWLKNEEARVRSAKGVGFKWHSESWRKTRPSLETTTGLPHGVHSPLVFPHVHTLTPHPFSKRLWHPLGLRNVNQS